MNFRLGKFTAMMAGAVIVSSLIGGCSSSHSYNYKHVDIDYSSVYLNLQVSESEYNKLGDAYSASIYAYSSSGTRLSYSNSQVPVSDKNRKKYAFFCSSQADNVTIDFYDTAGKFLGCSTINLPELGKDLNKSIDVDKVYTADQAKSAYSLSLKEISADNKVGGMINLEAMLKTPCGMQVVSDNSNAIDWSSSDIAVISTSFNGSFQCRATGKSTLGATYNDIFSASKTYTVTK